MDDGKKGLTVLITGGSGFIAQHLVKQILEQTELSIRELRTFDLRPLRWIMGIEVQEKSRIKHIEGDISNLQDVDRALSGVDAVFHACSMIDYSPYPDMTLLHMVNIKGTENVIQACRNNSVQYLVYTSTIEVANNKDEQQNANEDKIDPNPTEFVFRGYGETKLIAEKLVCESHGAKLADGSTLKTCALRPSGVYGEGDLNAGGQLRASYRIGVWVTIGKPYGKLQWTYAGNVAWAHVKALEELVTSKSVEPLGGKALFLGDNSEIESTGEFFERYAREINFYIWPFTMPFWFMYIIGCSNDLIAFAAFPFKRLKIMGHSRVVRYLYSKVYFDWSKSRKILGYTPKYTPKESFRRSLVFYKHYAKTSSVYV